MAWLLLQIFKRCLRQQAPLLQPFLLLMSQANPQSHVVLDFHIGPLMLKQMEDEVVEEAQPLGREQYTENSPSGNVLQRAARKTAEVWKTVKSLKDVSLMGKILYNDEGRDVLKFLEILNCLSAKNSYFWEIKTPKKYFQNLRRHLLQLASDSQIFFAGVMRRFPVPFPFP